MRFCHGDMLEASLVKTSVNWANEWNSLLLSVLLLHQFLLPDVCCYNLVWDNKFPIYVTSNAYNFQRLRL